MDESIKLIIACEAFRGELETFKELIKVDILWVEQAMHEVPDQLHLKIEEKIEEAENLLPPGDTVLLFFGNCGGALRGISSETLTLIYREVDDCILVILGSKEHFRRLQAERPGTFYLNKNWIDSGQDPLNSSRKYIRTYGEKKGWKISKLMYKNYHYFSLIDNGCCELEKYRAYTLETCEKFGKEYLEEKGDLKFIEAILNRLCEMVIVLPRLQNEESYQSRKAFFPEI